MKTLSDKEVLDIIDLLVKHGRFWVIANYLESGYTIRTAVESYMERYQEIK